MIRQPTDFQKYIYHFTTAKSAVSRIIPSGQLKFSKFTRLNDPKENLSFGFWSILDTINLEIDPELLKEIKNQIRKRIRVLCFTQDYREQYGSRNFVESGFKHPRMWDRYASRNRGVCLVFHRERLIRELSQQLGTENLHTERIYYTPKLNFPRFSVESYTRERRAFVEEYIRRHTRELFFMKHIDWRTEHEFRILYRGQQKEAFIGDSLHGIILGMDFNQQDTEEFLKSVPPRVQTGRIGYREGNLVLISIDK